MRHLPEGKYTVAWFKLAEFVTRGEKERALGMYRLLMHSVADRVLALQLEGDLLSAFNDTAAYEKYRAAAELYVQAGRLAEAAAMYEILISGEVILFQERIILADLYARMERVQFFWDSLFCLIHLAQNMDELHLLIALFDQYKNMLSDYYIKDFSAEFIEKVRLIGDLEQCDLYSNRLCMKFE